jgi:hypothetical protein
MGERRKMGENRKTKMMPNKLCWTLLPLAIALFLMPCVAHAERPMTGTGVWKAKCPKLPASPLVYGVGSSTMGTSLGASLEKNLKKEGVTFRKWGVASSGLARPEFHNWPKSVKEVVRERNPDIFVISVGTNDFQALFHKKKWIRLKESERWKKIYGERIDAMLEEASGRDRKRMVIWIAPTIFKGRKAIKVGKWIHELLLDRIQAFGGPVFLVDAYKPTTKNGEPLQFFKTKDGRKLSIYGKDNIHLTHSAVDHLMVDPTMELIRPCLPPKPTKP